MLDRYLPWSIFCQLFRSYTLWILEFCAYKSNIILLLLQHDKFLHGLVGNA